MESPSDDNDYPIRKRLTESRQPFSYAIFTSPTLRRKNMRLPSINRTDTLGQV